MVESLIDAPNTTYRRRTLLRGLVGGTTLLMAAPLLAACNVTPAAPSYPTKPISTIISAAPGGLFDLTARELAKDITPYLSQPLAIVNQPDAQGTVARVNIFQARPDGYTFGLVNDSMELQKYLQQVPWKSVADFTLIALLNYSSTVLAVKADAPWKTLQELIDYSKAHPTDVRITTFGTTGGTYLKPLMLSQQVGAQWTFIPTNADAEAITAAVGGHVEAVSTSVGSAMAQVTAGTLRVLTTFGEKRNPALPDVPCTVELGFDIPVPESTTMLAGPGAIPDPIAASVRAAVVKAMDTDAYKAFLTTNGLRAADPEDLTVAGLTKRLAQASDQYKPLSEIVLKNQQGTR